MKNLMKILMKEMNGIKMAFKEYTYGAFRQEIKRLLRKKLNLKDKIRYHKSKAEKFEKEDLPKIQEEIDKFLRRARGDF